MSQRALLAAVALALAVTVGFPLALLLAQVGDLTAVSAEIGPLLHTLQLVLATVALTWAVGVPVGLALARAPLPGWLVAAAALPYAIPPYVTTIAWIQLANPTTGWLVGFLPVDVYGLGGMAWVLGLHLAPVVALSVRDALLRVDPALEEAARLAGATPARVLRDVTLPLVRPALLAASGFVVAASAASFGVPYLLSAPAREPTIVLTTRIFQALELSPSTGRPLAVSLALVLLVVGVGLPAILRLADRRTGGGERVGRPPAQGPRGPAAAVVGAYVLVAAVVPLLVLVATSLMRRYGADLSPHNLTLAHWQGLLGDARTREALLRSAVLAAGAATTASAVGLLVAHAAERTRTRGARILARVATLPYAVPGTVLALGMLLAFSQEVRLIVAERITFVLALADTAWLLGLAYTVKLLALPVDGQRAALRTVHPSLEEAARVAGAGWARTLRDVTLPLLRPALLTGWWLVALPAFCEVTMSVLLKGPRTEVLGTRLFYLQSYADPQAACALAVVVAAVVLVAQLGLRRTT